MRNYDETPRHSYSEWLSADRLASHVLHRDAGNQHQQHIHACPSHSHSFSTIPAACAGGDRPAARKCDWSPVAHYVLLQPAAEQTDSRIGADGFTCRNVYLERRGDACLHSLSALSAKFSPEFFD